MSCLNVANLRSPDESFEGLLETLNVLKAPTVTLMASTVIVCPGP